MDNHANSASNDPPNKQKPKRLRLEAIDSVVDTHTRVHTPHTPSVYELKASRFLSELNMCKRSASRALPPIHSMLALAPQNQRQKQKPNANHSYVTKNDEATSETERTGSNMPLLRQFFDAVKDKGIGDIHVGIQ